jgi:CDP-diacylglycerol pyrophosphatase
MNSRIRAFLVIGIATTTAIAFASSAMGQKMHGPKSSTESPIDPKQPAGRSALRQIVQDQCVLNWQEHHNPAPCERVFLADPKNGSSGYAVIAAPGGGAHYLLVPTRAMAGTESRDKGTTA